MKKLETPTWIEEQRSQMPVLARKAYLNTGTAGPTHRVVQEAIDAELADELREGRGDFSRFGRFIATRERARSLCARLLGAQPAEVALTHHTSDGLNIVLWGLDWKPGDVVVTTTLEHDAVAVPLALLRDRRGVSVHFAEAGHGEGTLGAIEAALDERVRLVIVSHIVWSTGARLAVHELAHVAHRVGARLLVDGAQSGGVLPIDVSANGADYYTLSGQKWICGPEGTGALYVRRDCIDELQPTFASYFTPARHDYRGDVTLHDDARRYEVGMFFRPALAGFARSLEWIQDEVGVGRAWERSLALAARCRAALASIEGVRSLTPPGMESPLVPVDIEGWSPAHLHALANDLSRRGVVVRSVDTPPYALRASLGFFNTEADIERMRAALSQAVARGPSALPLTGRAARLPDTP